MAKELVDLELTLMHETDKAYLVSDGSKQNWLPKSMVEMDSVGTQKVFIMPEWLAIEKGLV